MPFAHAVAMSSQSSCCAACYRQGELKKCTRCQREYYCGQSCQRRTWRTHKHECAILHKLLPKAPSSLALLLVRVLRRMASHEDERSAFEGLERAEETSHGEMLLSTSHLVKALLVAGSLLRQALLHHGHRVLRDVTPTSKGGAKGR